MIAPWQAALLGLIAGIIIAMLFGLYLTPTFRLFNDAMPFCGPL